MIKHIRELPQVLQENWKRKRAADYPSFLPLTEFTTRQ